MKIDFEATYEKCKILNLSEVARRCGTTRVQAYHVVKGTYWSMSSESSQRILDLIREVGCLVEVPDETDLAAAA